MYIVFYLHCDQCAVMVNGARGGGCSSVFTKICGARSLEYTFCDTLGTRSWRAVHRECTPRRTGDRTASTTAGVLAPDKSRTRSPPKTTTTMMMMMMMKMTKQTRLSRPMSVLVAEALVALSSVLVQWRRAASAQRCADVHEAVSTLSNACVQL